MSHVIDLKNHKREEIPREEEEIMAEAVSIPDIEEVIATPAISHPISQRQEIFTDRGGTIPFHTHSWKAPHIAHHGHSGLFYLFIGALFLGAILTVVLKGDLLFGAVLFLIGVVSSILKYQAREGRHVDVEISPLHVRIDSRTYSHKDIRSFWIHYQPEHQISELSILLKQWYHPYVTVQLFDQDPVQVRTILIQYIPEEEHEELLSHTFIRRLGI